jgi:glutamine synthetase
MCDRHVIYKQAAKEIAIQQGCAVTFMAKFDEQLAGSSMHLHSSLWSDGGARAAFDAPAPSPGRCPTSAAGGSADSCGTRAPAR